MFLEWSTPKLKYNSSIQFLFKSYKNGVAWIQLWDEIIFKYQQQSISQFQGSVNATLLRPVSF